jgi:hypothetical protein
MTSTKGAARHTWDVEAIAQVSHRGSHRQVDEAGKAGKAMQERQHGGTHKDQCNAVQVNGVVQVQFSCRCGTASIDSSYLDLRRRQAVQASAMRRRLAPVVADVSDPFSYDDDAGAMCSPSEQNAPVGRTGRRRRELWRTHDWQRQGKVNGGNGGHRSE